MSNNNNNKTNTQSAPQRQSIPGRGGGGRGGGVYAGKAEDFKGTMKKLFQYIKPFRTTLIIAAVLSVTGALLSVVDPYLLGEMVTSIQKSYSAGTGLAGLEQINIIGDLVINIAQLALILMAVFVLVFIANYVQGYLLIGVTQEIVFKLRSDLSEKINKLPLSYFDNQQFGDVIGRLTNDVDTINTTLSQSFSEIFRSVFLVIIYITVMLILQPILAMVIFISLFISFLVTRKFVKISQKYFIKQANAYGELNGHVEETYNGQAIIKVFNYQEKAFDDFKVIDNELKESSRKSQFISGIMMPTQFFISNLTYISIAVVGAIIVSSNPLLGIGLILTFLQFTRRINHPIQQIGNIASILQATAAASERIFRLLDEDEESRELEKTTTLKDVEGFVEFKDVRFSYIKGQEVIKGLNAKIKPGQTVAIVGPTGAGKTTLVNLLMRFYEVDSGEILIDGINIKEMKRSEVRSLFGMVLQDTWLFEGTIYENINYGTKEKTKEEVISAAKHAQTHHFIKALGGGYEFMLNENGTNISQGQRQLVTIARAMLADHPMLILDEATSSVDTRTELLIQNGLDNLMKNRTSFVIAHRLSTIVNADLIFVIDKGNIVEQGTHEELIAQGGFYENLYNSQFEE